MVVKVIVTVLDRVDLRFSLNQPQATVNSYLLSVNLY